MSSIGNKHTAKLEPPGELAANDAQLGTASHLGPVMLPRAHGAVEAVTWQR